MRSSPSANYNPSVNTELIKFISANGFAAFLNFTTRIFFSSIFNYATAIVLAYFIGMTTAYILCRLLVFKPKKNNPLQQMAYFILVNIFALIQTLIISLILTNYVFLWINELSLRETSAHFIGICIPVFTSYIGHKYITFK